MANINAIPVQTADLYIGDDQAVQYTPDASGDDSGIDPSGWIVELRLAPGRVELMSTPPAPVATYAATWDSLNLWFKGLIPKADTSNMTPGRWTMDVWRTNTGFSRLLLRVALVVYPSVIP